MNAYLLIEGGLQEGADVESGRKRYSRSARKRRRAERSAERTELRLMKTGTLRLRALAEVLSAQKEESRPSALLELRRREGERRSPELELESEGDPTGHQQAHERGGRSVTSSRVRRRCWHPCKSRSKTSEAK